MKIKNQIATYVSLLLSPVVVLPIAFLLRCYQRLSVTQFATTGLVTLLTAIKTPMAIRITTMTIMITELKPFWFFIGYSLPPGLLVGFGEPLFSLSVAPVTERTATIRFLIDVR